MKHVVCSDISIVGPALNIHCGNISKAKLLREGTSSERFPAHACLFWDALWSGLDGREPAGLKGYEQRRRGVASRSMGSSYPHQRA